ncbi:MAG: hypothetical protein MUO31_07760 [Thermodesulfovibrionales bacterium]|nr:hypothetical protein [Thermodesulfovibrionales bacterium]
MANQEPSNFSCEVNRRKKFKFDQNSRSVSGECVKIDDFGDTMSKIHAKEGCVASLSSLIQKYGKFSAQVPVIAAKHGQVACLKWLMDTGAADFTKPSIWSFDITSNSDFEGQKGLWDVDSAEFWDSLDYSSPDIWDVKHVVKSAHDIHEGVRYEAAMAAVNAGHLECAEVCGIYNVNVVMTAARSGNMEMFKRLLCNFADYPPVEGGKSVIEMEAVLNIEWLKVWLRSFNAVSETAKDLACSKNCVECVKLMLINDHDFNFSQCMAATTADSTACIELLMANKKYVAGSLHIYRVQYAIAAARLGYTKSLAAWAVKPQVLLDRAGVSRIGDDIYNNCVALAVLEKSPPNYQLFAAVIRKYNPYNCRVDDDMLEIGHKLEHNPKLLGIWRRRMNQCQSYRSAHNACFEDDVDVLLKLLRHPKCNVRLWMFEDCVIHNSSRCLRALCKSRQNLAVTDKNRLDLIKLAKIHESHECVKVLSY